MFRWDNVKFVMLLIVLGILAIAYKDEVQWFLSDIRNIGNGPVQGGLRGLIPFGLLMLVIAGIVRALTPCPACERRRREEGQQVVVVQQPPNMMQQSQPYGDSNMRQQNKRL